MIPLTKYVLRRLLWAIPTLLGALTFIFLVLRILPGDPTTHILGDHATAESVAVLRLQLGLDRPLPAQYLSFMGAFLKGDLGRSLVTNRQVTVLILGLFPRSFELTVASMLFGVAIGVPVGVVSALRRNSLIDFLGRVLALTGISVPAFYLGILLLLLFSVQLGWFPAQGAGDLSNPGQWLAHLVLPAFTLGMVQAGLLTRVTRSSLLEVLHEDYVRTARAKGLRERRVVYFHAFRNALIPVVTVFGIQVAGLLGGAVVTETVFSRPGLGSMVVGAVVSRDYTVLQAALALFATMVILVNLVVDLLYVVLDPRIRYE